jgi:AmmeMemoRadiSam system protein A
LKLARDSILAHVTGCAAPAPPNAPLLEGPGAAFVTVHIDRDLRGCIGHIEAIEPLGRVIVRCAVAACSADPRFPPITVHELARMDLELSILGPLEAISGATDVEIGRHGLVVEKGWLRGLLLPQVASERSWDAAMFLAQTCRKAGLPSDAWQHGAKLWRFEAEVFGETTTEDTEEAEELREK